MRWKLFPLGWVVEKGEGGLDASLRDGISHFRNRVGAEPNCIAAKAFPDSLPAIPGITFIEWKNGAANVFYIGVLDVQEEVSSSTDIPFEEPGKPESTVDSEELSSDTPVVEAAIIEDEIPTVEVPHLEVVDNNVQEEDLTDTYVDYANAVPKKPKVTQYVLYRHKQ